MTANGHFSFLRAKLSCTVLLPTGRGDFVGPSSIWQQVGKHQQAPSWPVGSQDVSAEHRGQYACLALFLPQRFYKMSYILYSLRYRFQGPLRPCLALPPLTGSLAGLNTNRTDNHIKNRWNCTLKKRYGSMLETLRMEMAPGSVTLMDISNLMAQSMPNGGRLSLSAGGVGGIGVSGPLVRWPGQGTTGLGGPGTALGSTTAQLLAVTGSGQLAGLGTGQQMAMGPLALAMAGALGAGGTPPGGGAAGGEHWFIRQG